jgi:phosphatidylserine/phosphatidylglycerophosphate/cardiolipin synthase-like enzyme
MAFFNRSAGFRAYALAPLALVALASAGCSAGPGADEFDSSEAPLRSSDFSYVGRSVIDALEASPAIAWRSRTWDVSGDNRVGASWLVVTPPTALFGVPRAAWKFPTECKAGTPGCDADFGLRSCTTDADCGSTNGTCQPLRSTMKSDADTPKRLCLGHSDAELDSFYDVLVSGRSWVDITSLTPPDGRFEAMLRNGITRLSRRANPPQVRFLYGGYTGLPYASSVVPKLFRDVAATSPIKAVVGDYRSGLFSWNHAKYIAVDGVRAIQGGHNMWTDDYLRKSPVQDVSMTLEGSAASDLHAFSNELWSVTCKGQRFPGQTDIANWPVWRGRSCAPIYAESAATMASRDRKDGVKVVSLGRLGAVGANVADDALRVAIDAARTNLRISQQDFGPVTRFGISYGRWLPWVSEALARAIGRGVKVDIVVSSLDANIPGKGIAGTYSNGWTPADVADRIEQAALANPRWFPRGADVHRVVCANLKVAPIRSSADQKNPTGEPIGNHAKIVAFDDRAFYLGSQNLYDANLAETGYLVDDARVTASFMASYWQPLWRWSSVNAVSSKSACR